MTFSSRSPLLKSADHSAVVGDAWRVRAQRGGTEVLERSLARTRGETVHVIGQVYVTVKRLLCSSKSYSSAYILRVQCHRRDANKL